MATSNPQESSTLQSALDSIKPGVPDRVSRLVDLVLEEALRRSASDVHFEPTPRGLELRFRLDGVLHSLAWIDRTLSANIAARLKVLAELLTYRIDIPQEGSYRREQADMRVSTFPTIQGEKVVVRIFQGTRQVLDLEQLGLSSETLSALLDLMRERTGAILLTGPSGSGKTTTIYACLRYLVQSEGRSRHLVTIEDPVEQVLDGVSQSQARPGSEFDFARGLRSLLRQDPEVIMIGEVRDRETAAIAIEAALTGHLVFSTLHAGSSCGVINRLLEMGIEPYLLTSSMRGILNQRLVRRLCPVCRLQEEIGWRPIGCPNCAGTGYQGRLLLAELLMPDAALRQAILAQLRHREPGSSGRPDGPADDLALGRPGYPRRTDKPGGNPAHPGTPAMPCKSSDRRVACPGLACQHHGGTSGRHNLLPDQEKSMRLHSILLCCCGLGLGLPGCGPMQMPMVQRLDKESQRNADQAWDQALSPLTRFDHQALLDALMISQAYQLGVDKLTFRSEKRFSGGTVIMEIAYDRAAPAKDEFKVTAVDPQGRLLRQESYSRNEVEGTYKELFVRCRELHAPERNPEDRKRGRGTERI